MSREEFQEIILYEKERYGMNLKRILWGVLVSHPMFSIWRWQYYSRKSDYYSNFYRNGLFWKMLSLYYLRKRNRLAAKISIDVDTKNIGKGLLLFHIGNTVINGNAIIGENCILHGDNCIGNKGPKGSPCPIIGDNVEIGVGAKVIGCVKIANNIKIGAGAVVVNSFLEEGITIAGVPAVKLC